MGTRTGGSSRRTAVGLALLLAGAPALADSGIPGPAMWAFGSQTVSMVQWLVVTMAMCISVEWAVYRYYGRFRRPFVASAVSNTVSLVAGIPLMFIGGLDPTWFVLPTVISAGVEYMTIAAMGERVLTEPRSQFGVPVIWANVLSNLMLAALLYVAWLKAVGEFPDWVRF